MERRADHERLDVWQKAMRAMLLSYAIARGLPIEERYALSSQMRRAAVSVPANIAEGYKKTGRPDKLRFLNTAQGSLEECRYYLILTRDLGYGDVSPLLPLLEEASKLLEAYSSGIRRRMVMGAGAVLLCASCLLVCVLFF